ncbi:MAG: hypothetical protein ACI8PZ_005008 [Myxococcota bacterium]|jgi:hypothetical protein
MRFLIAAPLLLVASVASAQSLDMAGDCPGPVAITASGLTPGGTAVFLGGAAGEGSDVIGIGACSGTVTGLAGLRFLTRTTADGGGNLSFTPTVPEGRCDLPVQVLDTATCALTNVATPAPDVAPNPECSAYVELTDAYRNITWPYDYARCDSGITGWHRFTGAAGTQMPEVPPDSYSCGTHASGWLNGAHPAGVGDTAVVPSCNHWAGDICWQTLDIEVTNCGDFYVYNLSAPPCCSCVFCGEDPV